MGFFQRIGQWFNQSPESKQIPSSVLLQELIDKARRAQYAEEYDAALEMLSEAIEIAESEHDTRSIVDIKLSRADMLIIQGDYETARFILTELRDDSDARLLYAPLAYSLCSLGVLEQARDNLVAAQEFYEQARAAGEKIKTDGASGRAAAHLGDIYLAQGNASYAVYLLDEAVVKLNRSGDRELLGYFLGKLGLAQIQLGQVDQGELRLLSGLEAAMSIKHRIQMRYLNDLLGQQAFENNQMRSADTYFREAMALYPPSLYDTIDYANLLCRLSKVSLQLGKADEAVTHAKQSLSIAENHSDKILLAMAKAAVGLAMLATEDDNALPYLDAAVSAYDDLEADSFLIDILRHMAALQLELGNEEGAIAYYRQAIDKAEKLPLEAAKAHSDLALYYANDRQRRQAIQEWQSAIKYFQERNQTDFAARVHCDIAAMYDQIGDGRLAQREYGTALEMLSQIDDASTKGIILANVAAAHSEFGDVESAQDFFKQSIEIAQRTGNGAAEALRRGNYGRLLALSNRPKQALAQIKQAQRKSEDLGLPLQTAILLGNLALTYSLSNDIATALEYYQIALSQLQALDAVQWEASVEATWADTLLMTKDAISAFEHYERALELANDYALVAVLIQSQVGLAQVAILQDDLESAERKLSQIDPIAKRQNYRRLLASMHMTWSQLYAKQGKTEAASQAWDEAQKQRRIMRMSAISPDWL